MRRREVDNIWNFSLIGFALAYRAAVSIFVLDYWYVLNGLIGFGIFFILGHLFYYSRLFAGGDAKLLIALGPVLPLSYGWIANFKIFGAFIMLFLIGGSFYALIYSLVLVFLNPKNFGKQYLKQFKFHKRIFLIGAVFFILWIVVSFFLDINLIYISFIFLLFPVLFVFAKAVEESCLVRKVKPKDVTVGDWLYKDVIINRKKIKARWDGVSKKQLGLIRKARRPVLIKYGIPFTPSFLIGFLGLLWLGFRFGGF